MGYQLVDYLKEVELVEDTTEKISSRSYDEIFKLLISHFADSNTGAKAEHKVTEGEDGGYIEERKGKPENKVNCVVFMRDIRKSEKYFNDFFMYKKRY